MKQLVQKFMKTSDEENPWDSDDVTIDDSLVDQTV